MALCRYCLKVVSSDKCNCVRCAEGNVVSKVIYLNDYKKTNKK